MSIVYGQQDSFFAAMQARMAAEEKDGILEKIAMKYQEVAT